MPVKALERKRRKLRRHSVSRNFTLMAALALWAAVMFLSLSASRLHATLGPKRSDPSGAAAWQGYLDRALGVLGIPAVPRAPSP